ncbi:MAG: hypothetical protein QXG00_00005 [Candidatus Woesearchaeota archaeon]
MSYVKKIIVWLLVLSLSIFPALYLMFFLDTFPGFLSISTTMTSFGKLLGLFGMTLFAITLFMNTRFAILEEIFNGIDNESFFYFVHSYYVSPEDKSIISGITDYGITFTSMICKDNIIATQFHPEKSQKVGLKLLKNFGDFVTNRY